MAVTYKFSNKAEAMGFAQILQNYMDVKAKLNAAEQEVKNIAVALKIELYLAKTYTINLETLELTETA